jgi:hypothetical protein
MTREATLADVMDELVRRGIAPSSVTLHNPHYDHPDRPVPAGEINLWRSPGGYQLWVGETDDDAEIDAALELADAERVVRKVTDRLIDIRNEVDDGKLDLSRIVADLDEVIEDLTGVTM